MSEHQTRRETFRIPTLDCPDEFRLIQKGLAAVEGIEKISPDYLRRALRVEYDGSLLEPVEIEDRLRNLGFPGQLITKSPEKEAPTSRLRLSVVLGGLCLALAVLVRFTTNDPFWTPLLAVVSTVLSGGGVALAALRAIRLLRLDMNALMTIAAVGAIGTGEWFEAATAMFLFGVSLWLESYSMGRARRAVQTLVALTPTSAHRIELEQDQHREIIDVHPEELEIDDLIVVKPGERIPIDGVVVSGHSAVNQAPITGESLPVEKAAGESVFAGSLNGEGSLEVRTRKTAHNSTLAHVARLVELAQSSRSPTERFVDHFARYYTPAVVALAAAIALVPVLSGSVLAAFGVDTASGLVWTDWFHRALVLLVIACPCALVLSTPITIVCGLHRAAHDGMLIKGGQHLEAAGRIDSLAIDKTGTLTKGEARVVAVRPSPGRSEEEVLRIAAMLESNSEHPLAHAITSAAQERSVAYSDAGQIEALRGFGVQGMVDGETYYVASPRYFHQQKLKGDLSQEGWLQTGGAATVVLVGNRRHLLGAIDLADQPREDAKAAILSLKEMGIKQIAMLTGDSGPTAAAIGQSLGIEHIFAELLPEDKVAKVKSLTEKFPYLAMAGDGVNDAPALAASHLGIALGAGASDTALETADVVIMSPHLVRLPQLFQLGRRTRRLLKQNITLALAIKAVVLALAALGLASMWMAVAADVGASLLVIFNGMRLLKNQHPL